MVMTGRPLVLVAPGGSVYVIHTYGAVNDPAGDVPGLSKLADRLTLPEGWTFRAVVPDHALHAAPSDVQEPDSLTVPTRRSLPTHLIPIRTSSGALSVLACR